MSEEINAIALGVAAINHLRERVEALEQKLADEKEEARRDAAEYVALDESYKAIQAERDALRAELSEAVSHSTCMCERCKTRRSHQPTAGQEKP